MSRQHRFWAIAAMATTLVLAGCWGSDDDDSALAPAAPGSTEVPDSAGISTAAFFSYLLSLSGTDESSEPLSLKDSLAVPADDAAEPTPLT